MQQTPLKGAYLIALNKHYDERGSFMRLMCQQTLSGCNISSKPIVQSGISSNNHAATLRGMHYQLAPRGQQKWVFCLRGKIFDVILDLRKDSDTFGCSFGVVLEENNPMMFFIPEGFAHGFITMTDCSDVLYHLSDFQVPQLERTIRWDDPKFNIQWPTQPKILSARDAQQSDFNSDYHLESHELSLL